MPESPNEFLAKLQQVDPPRTGPEAARLIEDSYLRLSGWIEAHLPEVGMLIAATLLSLYGRRISDLLRRITKRWPFPLRVALFIAVPGLGFAALIASVSPFITTAFKAVGTPFLVPAILSAFIFIGILAERSGRI